jgi:hypothetical protein
MTFQSDRPASPSRLRRVVFAVVAAVVAAMFALSIPNVIAPWTGVNLDHTIDPASHRWHHALEGAVDTLLVAAIIALLLRPLARSLLAQFIGIAAFLAAFIVTAFSGPMFLTVAGALLLIPATYPRPAALLQRRSPHGAVLSLLAVAIAAAAALLPRAVQELNWQITVYAGEQAIGNAWATDAEHLIILATAGLLAGTRLPGWRFLAFSCAVVYAYLGTVSILLPHQPGSWGLSGGIAAYVTTTLITITTLTQPANRSTSEPAHTDAKSERITTSH